MSLSLGVRNFYDLLMLLAATTALVVGAVHVFELRRQTAKIRKLVSTRPIGTFPHYLSEITEIMQSARREILIMCDFPAYGSFSAFRDYEDYIHVIRAKAADGIEVTIVCLDAERRKLRVKEQFAMEFSNWAEWSGRHVDQLRSLLAQYDGHAGEITPDAFVRALEESDQRALEDVFPRARRRVEQSTEIPLYCWIVDRSSAIFAIPGAHERSVEHGFYSQDPGLVGGLQDIVQRQLSRSGDPRP